MKTVEAFASADWIDHDVALMQQMDFSIFGIEIQKIFLIEF